MSWRRLEASTEAHQIANCRVTMTSIRSTKKGTFDRSRWLFLLDFPSHSSHLLSTAGWWNHVRNLLYRTTRWPETVTLPNQVFFLLSSLRTDLHKLLPVIAHPKFTINSSSPDSSRLLVLVSIQGIIDLLLQYVTVSIIPTPIGTPNGSLSKHEIF